MNYLIFNFHECGMWFAEVKWFSIIIRPFYFGYHFPIFPRLNWPKWQALKKNDTIVDNCEISRMYFIYSNLFLMANIELLIIRKHGKLTIFLKLLHILIHISKIFINNFFHSLIWAEFESIYLILWIQHTAVWLQMYSAACKGVWMYRSW